MAYGMRIRVSTAQKIVTACAILHNICVDENEADPPNFDDERIPAINDGNMVPLHDNANADEGIRRRHARPTAREEILQGMRN